MDKKQVISLINRLKNTAKLFSTSLNYNISNIKRNGPSKLFLKICTPFLVGIAFLAILIVRALHPLILIRFGSLRSDRVGHLAINTELYCCERDITTKIWRIFDLFYYSIPIGNHQLMKMWGRVLHVCWFAEQMDMVNRLIPGYKKHIIPSISSGRDIDSLLLQSKTHLSFTKKEEAIGRMELRKMGLSDNVPFVCIYGRDPLYLKTVFPKRDWHYHDYRNSNIRNYMDAAEALTQRGYFVVRMGHIVEEALDTNNPMIIDYATKYRTDFLDVYLCTKCHFFLGVPAGIVSIAMIFRRPIAYVDVIPIEYVHTWYPNGISITKKLWLRKERRFLTFHEILDSGVGRFLTTEQYDKFGVQAIENTAEEITALVVEMDERLKGTYQITEEDKLLQQQFWSLFKPSELHGESIVSRIGAKFLRQNQELLYDKNSVLENSKLR